MQPQVVHLFGDATTVDGGTLTLSNALLSSPTQYVGYSNSGAVVQTGGTNTANAVYVGFNAGSAGKLHAQQRDPLGGLAVYRLFRLGRFHPARRIELRQLANCRL